MKKSKALKVFILVLIVSCSMALYSFTTKAAGPKRTTWETITVVPGDTVWSIAQYHQNKGDVRELVYEIKALNHLKGSIIYPGQELKIPINFYD